MKGEKMKNLKLRERFLALAMAGAMALMGSPAVKLKDLEIYLLAMELKLLAIQQLR